MKFDHKLLEQHVALVAEIIAVINKDLIILEKNDRVDELCSLVNMIERYNESLRKCISIYRKCERNLIR